MVVLMGKYNVIVKLSIGAVCDTGTRMRYKLPMPGLLNQKGILKVI
jgi:hypothetical protein